MGFIVIVDYGVGNIRSVENAFRSLGVNDIVVSKRVEDFEKASGFVLPGVGHFADAMRALKTDKTIENLEYHVMNLKKPLISFCVGMQVLFDKSEEGDCDGLGWIPGEVKRFQVPDHLTVPHFGWNDINVKRDHWLFDGMSGEKNFYFAHSFHAETDPEYIVASCDYGYSFPAVVRKGNIVGCQFHPEKSHRAGKMILSNYIQALSSKATW